MKKRLSATLLALCLLLTGCSSMLERSYSSVTAHVDRPTTAEDPSVLRVEDYRELVSAVLYLVNQGAEGGTVRLYDYTGDVSADLARACAEVATQDPLGAYAVDYIKHDYVKVVSYYEATLGIGYRRTMEQVRSMARVTGTGAIRTQLQQAMARFAPEVVLRVAYFSQNEEAIADLLREVYYDAPATALGMPKAQINLYPDTGRERVVEILLDYPLPQEELLARRDALLAEAEAEVQRMIQEGPPENNEEVARTVALELERRVSYDPDGSANAYDALMGGSANSQGLALAYSLLCSAALGEGRGGKGSCGIVQGTLKSDDGGEEPRFWNTLSLPGSHTLYFDPVRGEGTLYTEEEFFDLGYRWDGGPAEPEPAAEAPGGEATEPLQSENP